MARRIIHDGTLQSWQTFPRRPLAAVWPTPTGPSPHNLPPQTQQTQQTQKTQNSGEKEYQKVLSQDVHYYDTKLPKIPEFKGTGVERRRIFIETLESMKKELEAFPDLKGRVIEVICIMLRDEANNWDPLNGIHSEHLLTLVWNKIVTYEAAVKRMFFEQYAEILNGSCAQGRVTRIYQFYEP